ncbi:hypothetical protein HY041_02980 [Candidatus Roizmanbacteria bacterium]|nr:hypothetical protein [Candidatus Roizmanbacteria bacterium]
MNIRLNNPIPLLKKLILIVIIILISNLVSSFFLGALLSVSSNIQVVGLNTINFDPMITIAYMMLYYFVTLFFQPPSKAQFYLFLLTLFLSFSIPFIQGSLFLVSLYFLLRKFKII